MSHFSYHFFLHSDWLFQLFLLYDWFIKIVQLQAQNSAIYAKLIMSGTNQTVGMIIIIIMIIVIILMMNMILVLVM